MTNTLNWESYYSGLMRVDVEGPLDVRLAFHDRCASH